MIIAILGSNSQVARSIVQYYAYHELHLFNRAMGNYKSFGKIHYDMVINCVGVAKPKDIKAIGQKVVEIADKYDLMAMKYLKKSPETIYVSMSSGVVAERGFPSAYKSSKQMLELRHRDNFTYNIIDVRLFSYFSSYMDLDAGFLISEMIKCLKEKRPFKCTADNLVRDYIHPYDLSRLIISQKSGNKSIEAYSKKSITIKQILKVFQELGLKTEHSESTVSPTGKKVEYIPRDKNEFAPKYTSLETIKMELLSFL